MLSNVLVGVDHPLIIQFFPLQARVGLFVEEVSPRPPPSPLSRSKRKGIHIPPKDPNVKVTMRGIISKLIGLLSEHRWVEVLLTEIYDFLKIIQSIGLSLSLCCPNGTLMALALLLQVLLERDTPFTSSNDSLGDCPC